MNSVPVPTRERTRAPIQRPGRVGTTTVHADGIPKVKGEFEYSSDMRMDGMLWGATLRSAHPRADIWSLDTSRAVATPGVRAVLTHDDVPGRKLYGMERADQPVLARQHVRYQGEPIAIVAALASLRSWPRRAGRLWLSRHPAPPARWPRGAGRG